MDRERAEKYVATHVRLRQHESGNGWVLAVYSAGMWHITNDRKSGMSWDDAVKAREEFIHKDGLKTRRLANGGH